MPLVDVSLLADVISTRVYRVCYGSIIPSLFLLSCMKSEYVFSDNVTSGMIEGLLPGETHTFQLRARNVAGLSEPSNNQAYTPPSAGKFIIKYPISYMHALITHYTAPLKM